MNFKPYQIIRFFIAMVWLVNGIYAKILGEVPRHELIVEKILQTSHAYKLCFLAHRYLKGKTIILSKAF